MKKTVFSALIPLLALGSVVGIAFAQEKKPDAKPLNILLVAGGCCHDYGTQKDILKAGLEERLDAIVTIEYNPSKSTDTTFPIYEKADWAKGYDLVIHDECSANVKDAAYIERILAAHRDGVPAVNLHCAMHSYRSGDFRNPVKIGDDNAGWFEMIGLQSTGHGPQSPIDVAYAKDQPLVAGLENWKTINEELYNNIQVFEGTTVLARGKQIQKPRVKKGQKPDPNAKPKEAEAVVVWSNEYGPKKTRIFSTSLGHNNETVADDRYLDLVARGALWSLGRLKEIAK